ncbi:MAG: phosphoglycerate mutase family protein [Balneolaceae bacterium]
MKQLLLLIILLFSARSVYAQQANSTSDSTTIILVRHAEKLDDGTNNPHLSEDGLLRAERLKEILYGNYPIKAVFSTKYHRTQETATPIATALEHEILVYDLSNPSEFLQSVIENYASQTVLIVGHSNTTSYFANILLGQQKYEKIDEADFGNIYVVKAVGLGKALEKHSTY